MNNCFSIVIVIIIIIFIIINMKMLKIMKLMKIMTIMIKMIKKKKILIMMIFSMDYLLGKYPDLDIICNIYNEMVQVHHKSDQGLYTGDKRYR